MNWWRVLHWSKLLHGCRPSSPTWIRVWTEKRQIYKGQRLLQWIDICIQDLLFTNQSKGNYWKHQNRIQTKSETSGDTNTFIHIWITNLLQFDCYFHVCHFVGTWSTGDVTMPTYIISISFSRKRQSMSCCWRSLDPLWTQTHQHSVWIQQEVLEHRNIQSVSMWTKMFA